MKSTERTYRLIEKWGWLNWWPVERFIAYSGHKVDLFNIIDCLVLTSKGIVGIQTCSSDFAAHVKKLLHEEEVNTRKWLATPGTRLMLIGWRKLRMPGTKQRVKYYPRIAHITLGKKGKLKIKELPTEKEKK